MNKQQPATIPSKERLIVALDVATIKKAEELIACLGETVQFYKIGLELFLNGGAELLNKLVNNNKKVFLDLKFLDVPRTVGAAIAQIQNSGATFVTVHFASDAILEAAVENKGSTLKILVVTVLTCFDKSDLCNLGISMDAKELVQFRAKRALALGCDGVVASGHEAQQVRTSLGRECVIVTPGIRLAEHREIKKDDQKRVVGVAEALSKGADYIVVGRPVYQAENPHTVAESIVETISVHDASGQAK